MTRVKEIAANMRGKPTDELLVIWNKNDREEWSEDAFGAIKQVLVERGVTLPVQQVADPNLRQVLDWDVRKIKTKRKIYLLLFLLIFACTAVIAVGVAYGSTSIVQGATGAHVLLASLFLFTFLGTLGDVRETPFWLGVGIFICLFALPPLAMLLIAVGDRRIYDAIKGKESLILSGKKTGQ